MPEESSLALLMRLPSAELIKKTKELIGMKRREDAIEAVINHGRLEKRISRSTIHNHEVDLILSNSGARWDIKK